MDFQKYIPAIAPLVKDSNPSVCQVAAQVLAKGGKKAIPYLLESLESKEAHVRNAALHSLSTIRAWDKKTVDKLYQVAKEDDTSYVRSTALNILIQTGPENIPRVQELLEEVKDISTLQNVINSLGNYGSKGKVFVPYLIKALKDDNPQIRWSAALSLGRIGPAAQDAVPALQKATKDTNSNVRRFAQQALTQIQRKK